MAEPEKYRVVQWATGNVGSRSLKTVIEHPQMELVGLYVSSPDKLGKDAGELCGLPATGIKAVNQLADVLAAKPDCVIYMRQGTDFDEVCALLEAGANIVTTRGDFHHPRAMDPAIRDRVEARRSTAPVPAPASLPRRSPSRCWPRPGGMNA